MANDEHVHVALPKLYGAPAYARPPRPVLDADRPFDPDELPIEAQQTDHERELSRALKGRPYSGAAPTEPLSSREGSAILRGRPFRLRAIASRLRGHTNGNGV